MTREQWKERLPLIQAFAEGKEIEVNHGDYASPEWFTAHNLCFDEEITDYRIKPEPKLRLWKPIEVPVGAAFRHGSDGLPTAWVDTTPIGLILGLFCAGRATSYEELAEHWQYSIDHGKTWLPCGVVE